MSEGAPRIVGTGPLGLLCPAEPVTLELRAPATPGDLTLRVELVDPLRRYRPEGQYGCWRFWADARDAFVATIDPTHPEAPLRMDARARDHSINPEADLAAAARLHVEFQLQDGDDDDPLWWLRIPWVRDAAALADAQRRLEAPGYVRALAKPELPLVPGARIHVAAPDVREGDAIGNLALDAARALRHHGHEVQLWARNTSGELTGVVGTLGRIAEHARAGDLLFYQYSIEDRDLDAMLDCAATKLCFYQGITPPHFLSGIDDPTAERCRRGLEALPRLAGFDGLVAATAATADELRAALGPDTEVRLVPPTLNLGRFDALEAETVPPASGRFLLYVGRFAPHKGLGLLIDAFAAFAADDPTCDLVLAGAPGGERVAARRAALPADVAARIHVVERASDAALKALYQACTAYVSASEHEGFCVPLAEAMGFDKPVFAYETPAVCETLGGAGQTFAKRDPHEVAALWQRVLGDPDALERQLAGQRLRWQALRRAADGHLLWEALAAAVRRAARPS